MIPPGTDFSPRTSPIRDVSLLGNSPLHVSSPGMEASSSTDFPREFSLLGESSPVRDLSNSPRQASSPGTNSPSPVPKFLLGNSPTPVPGAFHYASPVRDRLRTSSAGALQTHPGASNQASSSTSSSSAPSLIEIAAPPRALLPLSDMNTRRLLFQEPRPTTHVAPPADPTDFNGIRGAAPFPPSIPNIIQRSAHWTDASARAFLENNANVDFGYLLPRQQRAFWLGWSNSENTDDAVANKGHHWFIDMTEAEWHLMRLRRYQIPLPPNLDLRSRF